MDDQLPPLPSGYTLPPAPWTIKKGPMDFQGDHYDFVISDALGVDVAWEHGVEEDVRLWRGIIRCVNATADPDILALAEHLAAMDPGQRGAAMDQVKHAIGDWG